jgi:hypothetical protein
MTEEKARELLGDAIGQDGSIWAYYGSWSPGDKTFAMTDGNLSADLLEAIAFWLRSSLSPWPRKR